MCEPELHQQGDPDNWVIELAREIPVEYPGVDVRRLYKTSDGLEHVPEGDRVPLNMQ